MHYYAQIDADGRCFASLCTHTPIVNDRCIEVPESPEAYVGRTYVDGKWQPAT